MANSNGIDAALRALPITGQTKAGNDKRTGVIGGFWVMAVPASKKNGNGKPKASAADLKALRAKAAELGLTVS